MNHRRLFSYLVTGIALVACANGTTRAVDSDDTKAPAESTQPTDPTGSVTLPTPSGDDDDDDDTTVDAGSTKDSGTTKDSSTDASSPVDAAIDTGSPVDAGGGTCKLSPPSNACGVAPQCGCAATSTCDVTNTTTGAVSCVLAGGGPQGSYCTSTSQCAKGMTCQANACRPYCSNPNGNCSVTGTGLCFSPEISAGVTTPNLSVCAITCDPLNPSGGCGTNNCLWFSADKQSDCRKAGTVAQFGSCSTLLDCKAGSACVNNPIFGYECENFCRLGTSDCGFFDCVDVYGANAPSSGAYKLGHCQ